jgi:uncharacterized protein DUF1841
MTGRGPEVAFGGYSRDELRRSYAEAWSKHRARSPLTPLESLIVRVIELHPEYQPIVQDSQAALAFEAGDPRENPFLHMGLHVAVREQLSIDRPAGIRELRSSLSQHLGDEHAAEHALMEALADTLWEAQHGGRTPDEGRYLDLARRRLDALTGR